MKPHQQHHSNNMEDPLVEFGNQGFATEPNQLTSNGSITIAQWDAISQLQGVDEQMIMAWIAMLRSLAPGYQYTAGAGGITLWQFDAVNALRDLDEDTLLMYLRTRWLNGWSYTKTSNGLRSTH